MNPHAVPSRMTIAQLIECILGKSCSHLGYYGDGTGFNDTKVEGQKIISIVNTTNIPKETEGPIPNHNKYHTRG